MDNGDAYLTQLLQNSPHQHEALSWLQRKDGKERTIGESSEDMDAPASLRFVQDLYKRGATQVTAIDIESNAHMESTSTLIIKLPAEAGERAAVFQVEAKIAQQGGTDPEPDQGQQYIMLHW